MQGLTFAGSLEDQMLKNFREDLKHLGIELDNELQLAMDKVHTDYQLIGKTPYDYKLSYTIGTLLLKEKSGLVVKFHDIRVDSLSQQKQGMLFAQADSVVKVIEIHSPKETVKLENLLLDLKAENLDIQALELLQRADVNDTAAIDKAMTKLLK